MGRPPLGIGTAGDIRCHRTAKGYRAIANFRDYDGVTRQVERAGKTQAKAKQALKDHLRDRQRIAGADLTRDSTLTEAGLQWLDEVQRRQRGTTYDRCHSRLHGRLIPALGNLRLHELSTRVCDRYLVSLYTPKEDGGAGLSPVTARSYRAALSGIMRYSVRMGALTHNPVREVAPIRGTGKQSRALTRAERDGLLAALDADKRAVQYDLPSIVRFMLGTGVRIGEAMGLRWSRIDLTEGVVVIGDNLVWETRTCGLCGHRRKQHKEAGCRTWTPTGGGAVLHSPKTEAGFRVLPLPAFVHGMLEYRWPGEGFGLSPVFPNALGGWRDPNNTERSIRLFRRDHPEFKWVTSHVFRHTSITICDQAGIQAREISGYHGHARPSFTQDRYMDRRQQSGAVPRALDAGLRPAIAGPEGSP